MWRGRRNRGARKRETEDEAMTGGQGGSDSRRRRETKGRRRLCPETSLAAQESETLGFARGLLHLLNLSLSRSSLILEGPAGSSSCCWDYFAGAQLCVDRESPDPRDFAFNRWLARILDGPIHFSGLIASAGLSIY
jgi:hypothetical protein